MIPSEDMLRAYRIRAAMAIAIIVVGVVMLVVTLVHLAYTHDVVPLLFVAACMLAGAQGTRRLLDPLRAVEPDRYEIEIDTRRLR